MWGCICVGFSRRCKNALPFAVFIFADLPEFKDDSGVAVELLAIFLGGESIGGERDVVNTKKGELKMR